MGEVVLPGYGTQTASRYAARGGKQSRRYKATNNLYRIGEDVVTLDEMSKRTGWTTEKLRGKITRIRKQNRSPVWEDFQ